MDYLLFNFAHSCSRSYISFRFDRNKNSNVRIKNVSLSNRDRRHCLYGMALLQIQKLVKNYWFNLYHSIKGEIMGKAIIGLALIIISIVLGLYLGVWVMFIGGVVQIINTCQIHPVQALPITIGLVRILGATAVGIFSFAVVFIAGLGFLKSSL
jgi:hypothetical protein